MSTLLSCLNFRPYFIAIEFLVPAATTAAIALTTATATVILESIHDRSPPFSNRQSSMDLGKKREFMVSFPQPNG
jgi:hypothetical protein